MPAGLTPGAEASENGSGRRHHHQRSLGDGDGRTGRGWNAPSLRALLASEEYFPAGAEVSGDRGGGTVGNASRPASFPRNGGAAGVGPGFLPGGKESAKGGAGTRGERGETGSRRLAGTVAEAAATATAVGGEGGRSPALRLRRASASFRWGSASSRLVHVENNDKPSRFVEDGDAWDAREWGEQTE